MIVSDGLSVAGLFSGPLYISKHSIWMKCFICKTVPCFYDSRHVCFSVKPTLLNTPCHSIKIQGRTTGFFTAKMFRVFQAYIPKTVFTLKRQQGFHHGK